MSGPGRVYIQFRDGSDLLLRVQTCREALEHGEPRRRLLLRGDDGYRADVFLDEVRYYEMRPDSEADE